MNELIGNLTKITEKDDNQILASFGGGTVLFEYEGAYNDGPS